MLRIKAFPRIHISLIGMNNDGYRLNGGVGFSIASPILEMHFEPARFLTIIDKRNQGFISEEQDRLRRHLDWVIRKEQFDTEICCLICDGMVQSHVGYGSNTIIYLACVEALFILNKREYLVDTIIAMSGRGGTSGIGINSYFRGGFVFDTGITNKLQRPIAPSSTFVSEQNLKPLLFKELTLPQWKMGICVPPILPKTEYEEQVFFKEFCPIEKVFVKEVLYEAVYGVASALMEEDFDAFCKSINAIQHTRWKSLERKLYGIELREVEKIIKMAGAKSVGMSSLGPLLYFFGDNIESIVTRVKQEIPSCVCYESVFNNSGRIIEDD